jgi:hypothetical protein
MCMRCSSTVTGIALDLADLYHDGKLLVLRKKCDMDLEKVSVVAPRN